MKIYISGGISKVFNYREVFSKAEDKLIKLGHAVLNPAVFNIGLSQEDYMHISYAMIDCVDIIYMLKGWEESTGAKLEHDYALEKNKRFMFEEEEDELR